MLFYFLMNGVEVFYFISDVIIVVLFILLVNGWIIIIVNFDCEKYMRFKVFFWFYILIN